MELKCDNCGKIDYVLVDGYGIGDRLLEGVMFMVEDKDGKPHTIGVVKESQIYFDDFNKEKFLAEMESFCEHEEDAYCPKCDGIVDIWGAFQVETVIQSAQDKYREAVEYVGSANYQERENEALTRVDEAFEAIRKAVMPNYKSGTFNLGEPPCLATVKKINIADF